MSYMFVNCYALPSLDISSFDTSKVEDMQRMFRQCYELTTIYVSDLWSTASVTDSTMMFYAVHVLKGEAGTKYGDGNPKDMTYAHIDGGTSNPGYFTYKAIA